MFDIAFLGFLPRKTGFDISCKLSPLETICMKYQILFSGKNKKNIINLSVKFTRRVLKVIFIGGGKKKKITLTGRTLQWVWSCQQKTGLLMLQMWTMNALTRLAYPFSDPAVPGHVYSRLYKLTTVHTAMVLGPVLTGLLKIQDTISILWTMDLFMRQQYTTLW